MKDEDEEGLRPPPMAEQIARAMRRRATHGALACPTVAEMVERFSEPVSGLSDDEPASGRPAVAPRKYGTNS